MKLGNFHHRITFMCQGEQFAASLYLQYPATRQKMNRCLYQIVVDEGMKLADVYDVQFMVDGQIVYSAPAPPRPALDPRAVMSKANAQSEA